MRNRFCFTIIPAAALATANSVLRDGATMPDGTVLTPVDATGDTTLSIPYTTDGKTVAAYGAGAWMTASFVTETLHKLLPPLGGHYWSLPASEALKPGAIAALVSGALSGLGLRPFAMGEAPPGS